MQIKNLKELQQVIALCRRQGIASITIDGISLQLGPKPQKRTRTPDFTRDIPEANISVPQFQGYSRTLEGVVDGQIHIQSSMAQGQSVLTNGSSIVYAGPEFAQGEIETPDQLSEEQLMYYSVTSQEQ